MRTTLPYLSYKKGPPGDVIGPTGPVSGFSVPRRLLDTLGAFDLGFTELFELPPHEDTVEIKTRTKKPIVSDFTYLKDDNFLYFIRQTLCSWCFASRGSCDQHATSRFLRERPCVHQG
jgi:hypothetical protein